MSATTQDYKRMLNAAQSVIKDQAAVIVQLREEIERQRRHMAFMVGFLCEEVNERRKAQEDLDAIHQTFPWLGSIVPPHRLLSGGGAS